MLLIRRRACCHAAPKDDGWHLSQRLACAASQRTVSAPLYETIQGKAATSIRIPVVFCGALGALKAKSSPRTRSGLDASTAEGLTEKSGEVVFA